MNARGGPAEDEAIRAGEAELAAWRARRRKEPDYERIDRRATRHPKYRRRHVHVTMEEADFLWFEGVRRKMNYGCGMSQSQFLAWMIGTVRKKYERRTKDYQKEWAIRQRGESP